tara:strand:+ start:121 stop:402 length:282 start_codon:yes stop_codon:yes gene_type:complete
VKITRYQIRRILSEALTQTDKREIERIARKEAQGEIEKVIGRDLSKTIQEEVSKALKDKATQQEVADISKKVIKKLYRSLAMEKSFIIDQVKV